MNLLIIHLSDIHFTAITDGILKRSEALVAAARPHFPHAAAIVVVVSGDIAQTGAALEYKLAARFLTDVRARLKGDLKVPVYIVLAPGNHDCDFRGDQAARQLVVDAVLKQSKTIPESYIGTATKVQKEYFAFRKLFEPLDYVILPNDRLWTSYKFVVSGFSVIFDSLNASWISTRHEQQGGLSFPFERYADLTSEEADLRVCVMHHPLNWYNQSNYRAFRKFIHRQSDIILTGHEHEAAAREVVDANDGHCHYVEGEALQTNSPGQSGFNVVVVNTVSREYKYQTLRLKGSRYEADQTSHWDSFRPVAKQTSRELAFSKDFEKLLTDPGANLKHFSDRELTLDDIFVYPDLDDRSDQARDKDRAKAPRLNANFLAKPAALTEDVLIQGDDEGGKTRLLYKLVREYHAQGFVPLLLRGDKIRSASPHAIALEISNAVTTQYAAQSFVAFSQAPLARKIVLLDDFDRTLLNAERRAALVAELRSQFGRILLSVGESFEVAEIFGGAEIQAITEMRSVKILPLGHVKRLELIRKWNRIGVAESTSSNELLKACDEAEKLIESTKLRFVASTSPIFVVSLLQAAATGVASEVHNSSFAHYYYFLIIGALEKGKIGKQELNPILSACTHLSWYIHKNGEDHFITDAQFIQFVRSYSDLWTATNPDHLLEALLASRLLERDGAALSFTYPYLYYYFLGKYASISQQSPEVQAYISYCLQHLYARQCANTLLFLAHHSGNSAVLDGIVRAIDKQFADQQPSSLEKADVVSIAGLLSHAPALRYQSTKPEAYRDKRAEDSDQKDSDEDGLKDKPSNSSTTNLLEEIVSLSKAMEIAGTLLTHQFSHYDRTSKNDAILAIFNGAMRAVKRFHSHFHNFDDLMKSMSGRLRDKSSGATADQIENDIRNAIALLIKIVTASFVVRAAVNLRTKNLDDNVQKVLEDNSSCAFRLIKIARDLQNPTRLPRVEIDRLRREQETNPAVMAVLQILVLQRLYAYETDHDDKDWAMSVFLLVGQRASLQFKSHKHPKP